MKNRCFLIIAVSISLVVLVTPLVGCGSGDDQVSDDDSFICPDTLLETDTYALSSERDAGGNALGNQTDFTSDTPEIFVTFWLTQDI